MLIDVLLQVDRRPPPGGGGDALVLGISLVSMGLLLALLVIFLGTWRRTRSAFTLGLVAFVAVLLLEDLTRVGRAFGFARAPGLLVIPEILELLALVVLLYLATR